jgi:predicted unusual protein kinase regulating ubiquinone biosynthesis (AarF/ABC1/UbiB family)
MDDASLLTALARYTRVGTTAAGFAGRLAGQQLLGRPIDDATYALQLKEALGNLRGPLMKVAQFLATLPDALPPEYAQAFLELQAKAPPMGPGFVRRRMSHELGPTWQNYFRDFNVDAHGAASLGQVHKATLHSGAVVACKLQYPQMEALVNADLQNLRALLGVYHTVSKALNTHEIQTEIREKLAEELNYTHEAANIAVYQRIFENVPGIEIPHVHTGLSTSRLLTMSWMDGKNILSLTDAPLSQREAIAKRLFYAWYMPFYHHGYIHGDPHPGNYLVGEDHTLQLLDFGCVRAFTPPFVQGVITLYRALLHNRLNDATHAYEMWGFQNLTKAHIDVMHQWATLLFGPLLEDRKRPIQEGYSASAGWETAMKLHQALHKLGGITPPKEFVFMDRAAVGLGGVFMRLKVELNWHRLLEEILESMPS